MSKVPPIRDFAVRNPYTISCEETLTSAERMMRNHRIRHLPVLDGRHVYGIVSDRDISLAKAVNAGRTSSAPVFLKDICIYDPYIVDEETPLDTVVGVMAKRRLGSAIVTKNGTICGIFTTVDACKLLERCARGERL
jgi:acetoin utilization protein AcuB